MYRPTYAERRSIAATADTAVNDAWDAHAVTIAYPSAKDNLHLMAFAVFDELSYDTAGQRVNASFRVSAIDSASLTVSLSASAVSSIRVLALRYFLATEQYAMSPAFSLCFGSSPINASVSAVAPYS